VRSIYSYEIFITPKFQIMLRHQLNKSINILATICPVSRFSSFTVLVLTFGRQFVICDCDVRRQSRQRDVQSIFLQLGRTKAIVFVLRHAAILETIELGIRQGLYHLGIRQTVITPALRITACVTKHEPRQVFTLSMIRYYLLSTTRRNQSRPGPCSRQCILLYSNMHPCNIVCTLHSRPTPSIDIPTMQLYCGAGLRYVRYPWPPVLPAMLYLPYTRVSHVD